MLGTIKVEFNELAKSVTANVRVELSETEINDDNLTYALNSAKALFEEAHRYAVVKTINKGN